MDNSLLDEYNSCHPDFLDSLMVFSEEVKNRIVKRLKAEKDRNNFLSTIVEVRFGKLFNQLGFAVDYDKRFSNDQRPDWLINIGNSSAICDVYRLGKSAKDQNRSDFENKLIEKLRQIPGSYAIKIGFIDQYFDTTKSDIDVIVKEVHTWLFDDIRKTGDDILVLENFEFSIVKSDTSYPHVCCIGNASSINIKPEKVKQFENLSPNEITKKLHKYDSIIEEHNMPYLICVYIDFASGFNHEDIKETFLGRGSGFADFGTPIGNMHFSHLGQEWTDLGEFYNNLQVSGFITFYNEQFQLLLNPVKNQIIYGDSNKKILKALLAL